MMGIGKQRGLSRLANENGHFTMVALDQRPPLAQALAKVRGVPSDQVTFADMAAAKRMLVQALGTHASSMLFDPNFAMPAAIDVLPPRTGLIVTLEEHRAVDVPGGRLSRSIDNWNVEKIRRIGGDAVKVLVWYRPDAGPEVLAHQQDYVRSVGAECRRHDIPYVLELLVYPFTGSASHTTGYVESPDKRAAHVIDSVREFAKPEYGVDLFKLESPIPASSLPAMDGGREAMEASKHFEAIGEICAEAGIPWVLLSAGASTEKFELVLRYSYAAGAQGFLAGRTIWLDAVQSHFPDQDAVLKALKSGGIEILQRFSEVTRKEAKPWKPVFDVGAIGREGAFCAAYV